MKRTVLLVYLFVFLASAHGRVKNPKAGKLFDDTRINTIEILIDTAQLSAMNRDRESNEMRPATFIIHYADDSDTVYNVGIRPKGNFSRSDRKVSLKIGFNSFSKGSKYEGLEKLNINAYMYEPTHLRAHLAAKLYAYAGLPATRTAFANLYINGEYNGLYNVVEHVDDEFVESRYGSKEGNLYKCLLGANLTYLGTDVSKYDTLMGKRPKYELKTNEEAYDYSGLMEFTNILTNTPDDQLEQVLEQRFNVEDYIKCMAVEVLLGGWDGYLLWCNNYYLYDNPVTGKFEFIPYDFDHTFGREIFGLDMARKDIYDYSNYENFFYDPDTIEGITQGGLDTMNYIFNIFRRDTRRPLYDRLLTIENYRNQYNYHLQTLKNNFFNNENLDPQIDRLFAMLLPSILNDPFVEFSKEEIIQSIDSAIDRTFSIGPWTVDPFPYGLKDYIAVRTASLEAMLEPVKPLLTLNHVTEKQKRKRVTVRVAIEGDRPEKVRLHISNNQQAVEIAMFDDGLHGDKQKNDGIYGCRLQEEDIKGRTYYITAKLPEGDQFREPILGYCNNPNVSLASTK